MERVIFSWMWVGGWPRFYVDGERWRGLLPVWLMRKVQDSQSGRCSITRNDLDKE